MKIDNFKMMYDEKVIQYDIVFNNSVKPNAPKRHYFGPVGGDDETQSAYGIDAFVYDAKHKFLFVIFETAATFVFGPPHAEIMYQECNGDVDKLFHIMGKNQGVKPMHLFDKEGQDFLKTQKGQDIQRETRKRLVEKFHELREQLREFESEIDSALVGELYTEEDANGWSLDTIAWRLSIANKALE